MADRNGIGDLQDLLRSGKDLLRQLRTGDSAAPTAMVTPPASANPVPGSPGTIPQASPGAKPSPLAPQLSGAATNARVYQRILDEWRKVADPQTGFEYFCEHYVWINNQKHGYVKFRLYDYQRRAVKTIQNNRFVITKKFRQAGMSLMTGVYCLWYSLVNPRMQCMIISIGQRESSKYLQENVREVYEALPRWMKGGLDDKGVPIKWDKQRPPKDSATEIRLPNRSKIRSIPSGKAGGRSFSTKILIIDEAAFIENIEDIWAGIYSTISNTGGSVFAVSTVNGVGGVGGWYYQTYKGAQEGENSFKIAEMDYSEHPDYNNPEWVRETRGNLGERRWRQEVLGEFLASGNTFIDVDWIQKLESKVAKPVKRELGDKLWVWKEYVEGHHYVIGADCATRGGLDYSTAEVIDIEAGEQVAEYRGKIQEDMFAKVLADLGYRYGTAYIVPEMNAKAGGAVTTSLGQVQKYKRLFRQENGDIGWNTTVRTREMLIAQFEASIYNEDYKFFSSRIVDEMKTFIVTKTGKIEHDINSHDDLLFAWMIGTTPEIIRLGMRATPKQPSQILLINESTEEGFVGTSKPIYGTEVELAEQRKKRQDLIAGTQAGKQLERINEMNEVAGDDILSWLLK